MIRLYALVMICHAVWLSALTRQPPQGIVFTDQSPRAGLHWATMTTTAIWTASPCRSKIARRWRAIT